MDVATVNDKGQVVIPVEARNLINLKAGDKLLVMVHPGNKGLMLLKPDSLEAYANHLLEQLSVVKGTKRRDTRS